MNQEILKATVRALLSPGKGLLAADESLGTIEKRFNANGIETNPQTRRVYREMLLTTPNCASFLSGVILFDETLRDTASDGPPFPQLLSAQGIVPGIKVDAGAKDMALFPGALSTAVGAFIPLIPFFFLSGFPAVIAAAIISLVAHFAVGAAKT